VKLPSGVYKHKKLSEETKRKISIANKGKKWSVVARKEFGKRRKGIKFSEKHKENLRKARIRDNVIPPSREGKMSWNKGKTGIYSSFVLRKLREARIKQIARQQQDGLPITPNIGEHETEIINFVEDLLRINFERNHKFYGYFIDGFNYEHKLAIEVDEPFHYKNGKLRKKDIKRQANLQRKLNCNFIRVKDNYINIVNRYGGK